MGVGSRKLRYDESIELALGRLQDLLKGQYVISKRLVGLLLLQGDPEVERQVRDREGLTYEMIQQVVAQTRANYGQPLSYVISLTYHQEVKQILDRVQNATGKPRANFADSLSRAMMNPITGIPILLIFLYFGLYQLVGVFGAGVAVDFLETSVFEEHINPWFTDVVNTIIPIDTVQDLFAGEYGIITFGLRYAVAIILPIVATFFLVFSVIEDSGYLPRLTMLIDRVFKQIGLSGRAVIPMVLGFGCSTMATTVTRTQETRRERIIATLLLALAIPCSAQLGVIFGILSGNPLSLMIWIGVICLVFLFVGYLASRMIPGRRPSFYMEVPPLRLPKVSNVLSKTYSRMQWYFLEILPIFILVSFLIWIGEMTGLFDAIVNGLEPLVMLIGLPSEAAVPFLFGFFRRDFGAAGLYDLETSGVLVGVPMLVAAVTMTLFVPCIAQFAVMLKERGWKVALAIAVFIFPFAFAVGFALNSILTAMGVSL